jgi:hypothetical protein
MSTRMHNEMPFLPLVIILITLTGSMLCFSSPQNENDSNKELIAKLNEFRLLRENSHFIDALQKGYDAANNVNIFNNSNYSEQESLIFEVAVFHLEYIDRISNSDQAKHCAEKAVALWKRYIDWFDKLSGEQRSNMHGSHIRISMAIAHLGNSLIRKGDLFQLFDCYANIAAKNLNYFGTDAMSVWKDGLYGCPDGNLTKPHTAANRRNSIENGCEEHWNNYASTLKEWVNIAPLQNSAKIVYSREIEQVEREIKNSGGEL